MSLEKTLALLAVAKGSASGVNSTLFGDDISIDHFGNAIKVSRVGDVDYYASTMSKVSPTTGTIMNMLLEYAAKETRTITQGNYANIWVASKVYYVGDVVRPITGGSFIYQCNVAGTSSATQPTWPTTIGATVVDGTVTWACLVAFDRSGAAQTGAFPENYGDFTNEFVGTSYEYTVVPLSNYVLQRIYYRLGDTLTLTATDSIRVRAYRANNATDETKKFLDRTISPSSAPYTIAPNAEIYVEVDDVTYLDGEEVHWKIELISTDPMHEFSLRTNNGSSQPWRAVDRVPLTIYPMVHANMIYSLPTVTSPTNGATLVSRTPTVVTAKGAITSDGGFATKLAYTHTGTKIKFVNLSNQTYTTEVSGTGLSITQPTNLNGSTQYRVQYAHKTQDNLWTPWLNGPTFTTMLTRDITVTTTGMVSGDAVQIRIGESAFSTGFDFHVSGVASTFPPAAYNSGSFQFRDSASVALNFAVTSLTGVAPSRTATIAVEVNATVIGNGIIVLSEQ